MSDSKPSKSQKPLAAKNDKNLKRYSDKEKTLLYELFERYQEIIDIKLRRNSYSSTKQCEVRECWELILKTFNEDPCTSKRTLKQLQKFWLNAKLRRMIPNYKQQSESELRRISNDGKLLLKAEPTSANERDSFANAEFQVDDGIGVPGEQQQQQDIQYGPKPHIFSINYAVPSGSAMPEQHAGEASGSFQQTSNDINRTLTSTYQQTDESDLDQQMNDDSEEVFPDNGNSFSLSNRQKIEKLRLQEMQNRVTESQLRCQVQRLIVSKAEEEFKHLQEINRLKLQEAKLRLKLLEQNGVNERGNTD